MAFLFTGASAHEMTVKELFVEQAVLCLSGRRSDLGSVLPRSSLPSSIASDAVAMPR